MDIIEIIKVIFLGIVEGITEWLPVSSTGHMIIFDAFVKLDFSEAFKEMFFVVIQLGAILAVALTFFNRINPFSTKKNNDEKKKTWGLLGKIALACLPAGVIGLLFDDFMDENFYNFGTVAFTLILYGIFFIIIEMYNKKKKDVIVVEEVNDISLKTAVLIGCFQVLALVPGTSRSGSTILGALLLNVSRVAASEFSFLLSLPVMVGASAYKLLKYFMEVGFTMTSAEIIALLLGMFVAFIVSIFAIKFLMGYIKKHDFTVFGYYRIVLGIIVIACGLFGVIA